ncbi:CHAT domain-containing tetratricopeptide repeat protein [Erythrobacter sp.]|uniref:CHAT domain-containing tetratricopeptide repeat protein n=1 Tax=Erythrobacter sp. TaxID=1042 RepID=UPI001425EBFF|nr:CHAT domain-containing tetratricopeptide repeat protein [Erythrobacter sp.]QIQ87023.1 MAG: CHAT domain-containing protein [Erythrobacter sp.]
MGPALALALALALAGPLAGAAPLAALAAQENGRAASEVPDPEAEVARLIDRATQVFNATTPDAEGAAAIIAAWEDVQRAARRIDPDHPAIARAAIPIASQLYNLGRNDAAREAVEAGLAGLAADDPDTLAVRAEGVALLGTLLAQAGEADAAVAALEEGYRDYTASFNALGPEEIGRSEAVSKSNLEFSLSQVMLQLSRIEEALDYQRASLATREQYLGPNDPDTIASVYGLAGTLRRAGRMEEAEAEARVAVERAVAHVDPSHPSYARALEMLAIILSRSGRPIEATDYLVRSLELKREHEGADSLFFGYGIHLLATILHQRERYAEAVPLFDEAAPIFAKYQGEGSPFGLGSQGYAAQGAFALGRGAEALERLRALDARMAASDVDTEIAKRIGPDLVRALVRAGEVEEAARIAARDRARLIETEDTGAFALRHAVLVDAYAKAALAGDPGGAAADARAMLYFLEAGRVRASGAWQAEERAALDLIMEIALAANEPDILAQAIALATGSGIAQASALRAERLAARDGDIAAALKALQEAEAALEAADRALLRALAAGSGIAAARARLGEAVRVRDEAFAALKGRDAALGRLLEADRVTIPAIRARLGEGEALLAIAPAYDGAYSLLVTPGEVLMNRIALPRAELVAVAAAVRDGAAAGQFDAAVSARLAEALLPAGERAALAEADTLRILAGGPLASLPFGVLVLDNGPAPAFLADRFALANVASFDRPAAVPERRASGFVAFAAPTPFGRLEDGQGRQDAVLAPAAYFARSGADFARLAALPPLPGSEREARMIAREYEGGETRLFLGNEASEARLADPAVSQARILLFATHGLVGGELEGIAEPALVLARGGGGGGESGAARDGLLTASEIARLDLAADWVLLTACDSAAGFEGGATAFSGLVAAFRFAGGGSLLATHWKVRDDVAAYVAVHTLRRYREHGDKPRALAEAIASLRGESGLPGADRPEAWGPFVLID